MTYDTAIAIGVVTGTSALIEKAEKSKGGMVHMCQAVDEALQESKLQGIQEGEQRGRLQGIEEGFQDGRFKTVVDNLIKIMKKFHVGEDEAMNILEIPTHQRPLYITALIQYNA